MRRLSVIIFIISISSAVYAQGVTNPPVRTTPYTRSLLYPTADANELRPYFELGCINVNDYPYLGDVQAAIDAADAGQAIIIPPAVDINEAIIRKGRVLLNHGLPKLVNSFTWSGADLNAHMVVSDGVLYVCEYDGGKISAWSLADPRVPVLINQWSVGAGPRNIIIKGRYLFVSCTTATTTEIWDIADLSTPVKLTSITVGTLNRAIEVVGNYLYSCATGSTGVKKYILDRLSTSDTAYELIGSPTTSTTGFNVDMSFNGLDMLAIVGLDPNVVFVDHDDLTVEILTVSGTTFTTCEFLTPNLLLAASSADHKLYVIHCEWGNFSVLNSISVNTAPEQVTIVGDRVYIPELAADNVTPVLSAIDISDANEPYLFKSINLTTEGAGFTAYYDGYLYICGHYDPFNIDIVQVEKGPIYPAIEQQDSVWVTSTGDGPPVRSVSPTLECITLEQGDTFVTNGAFVSATTGWTASTGTSECSLAIIAGGQDANCLELTMVNGASGSQNVSQDFTGLISGRNYILTAWVKSGTSGDENYKVDCRNQDWNVIATSSGTTSSDWVRHDLVFTATSAVSYKIMLEKSSATAGTMLFDEVSLDEISLYTEGDVDIDDRLIAGSIVSGTEGIVQGTLTLWDGAGGNTPAYIKILSPNGTAWYIFVEDDGTIKAHSAVPTQNSDGSAVGSQS